MKLIRSLLVIFIFTQLLSLGVEESRAQQQQPDPPPIGPVEYELKAVWLYHFGNSMFEWNERPNERPNERTNERTNDPFVISVFGDYPADLRVQLNKVSRLEIQGRRVIVRQSNNINNLKQPQPDILFITRGNDFSDRVKDAKSEFEKKPVLVVGDFDVEKDKIPISFSVDANTRELILHRNTSPQVRPQGIGFRNEQEIWQKLTYLVDVQEADQTSSISP